MKCDICNSEAKEILYNYVDKNNKVYYDLKKYECENCGHTWIPFEEEIKVDFFRKGYEEWKKKRKKI